MDELKPARHQRGSIQRRNWFSQDSPLIRGAPLRGWVQPEFEMTPSDEFLIGDVKSGRPSDHPGSYSQAVHRITQLPRRQTQKRLAGRRRRESETLRIKVGRSRLTSGCCSLVRADSCIALDQLYARDRYAQFFRDQLGLRGKHALSKIALSRVSSNRPVRADRQPGI